MLGLFNSDCLPGRRMQFRAETAIHENADIYSVVHRIKEDLAMQLVRKILEGSPFFQMVQHPETNTFEYSVDCIILTLDEYADVKRRAFKEGMKHVHGFINY